jgi:GNAT superfamily N-acetyltransferase
MTTSHDALFSVVSTAERPDLVPVVADWLYEAFSRNAGYSLENKRAAMAESVSGSPMPRVLVLLAGGEPAGTASLTVADLDLRPDLSPWLASVYVRPEFRGRGIATHLVAAVEQEARSLGVATLWLYTNTAEALYARQGWRIDERFLRRGMPYALMKRELTP